MSNNLNNLAFLGIFFLSLNNAVIWWWFIQIQREMVALREIKINLDGVIGNNDLIVKVIESNMRTSGLGDK